MLFRGERKMFGVMESRARAASPRCTHARHVFTRVSGGPDVAFGPRREPGCNLRFQPAARSPCPVGSSATLTLRPTVRRLPSRSISRFRQALAERRPHAAPERVAGTIPAKSRVMGLICG